MEGQVTLGWLRIMPVSCQPAKAQQWYNISHLQLTPESMPYWPLSWILPRIKKPQLPNHSAGQVKVNQIHYIVLITLAKGLSQRYLKAGTIRRYHFKSSISMHHQTSNTSCNRQNILSCVPTTIMTKKLGQYLENFKKSKKTHKFSCLHTNQSNQATMNHVRILIKATRPLWNDSKLSKILSLLTFAGTCPTTVFGGQGGDHWFPCPYYCWLTILITPVPVWSSDHLGTRKNALHLYLCATHPLRDLYSAMKQTM